MDHEMHDTEHHDEHDEHVKHAEDHGEHSHLKLFIGVAIALAVLTLMSFSTEVLIEHNFISVGMSWFLMMAVSCAKALLVIVFFMHLKWETNWKWVLTIPASIMSLFLVLMLIPDVGNRTNHYSRERLDHAALPAKPESDDPAAKHDESHGTDSLDAEGDANH